MTDAVIARLLNDYQRDFPLEPRPYARIGAELGISEDAVLKALRQCRDDGTVSRVGAVVRPNAVGVSTLAAMAVPGVRLHGDNRRLDGGFHRWQVTLRTQGKYCFA